MLAGRSHQYFMEQALREAEQAYKEDEVPVGAVLVAEGQIISRAHNQVEALNDTTAHAEILAITSASSALGIKFLDQCTLYVTLEPCVMCAGAFYHSRIGKLVFGAADPKRGFELIDHRILHPRTEVIRGVLEAQCSSILTDFFKEKRQ